MSQISEESESDSQNDAESIISERTEEESSSENPKNMRKSVFISLMNQDTPMKRMFTEMAKKKIKEVQAQAQEPYYSIQQ